MKPLPPAIWATLLAVAGAVFACTQPAVAATPQADYQTRLPQDEVIYFLLPDRFENGDPANDRGGLAGDRLKTGYDPTAKGFYHGGDIKGLMQRLDYVQALGVTAIWVGPIFKNKPVQGPAGDESAGYHGYWVTDFTQVDPHFGTNADFAALVAAAHGRGMKVYMDIIINHTADVIQFRECQFTACGYRSRADYPYQRALGVKGVPINPGFAGDSDRSAENFAKLVDPNFAYQVFVPKAEEHIKKPDWLNDPIYYHNRGNSTFRGESSTAGDFVGLDDLMTENPRVVSGMIDIFGGWIDQFGVDGFRIDTAQHVNPEFWQAFVPAMLARAKARGIPNFHIFGEIGTNDFDTARLARHTRVDGLPAVLDFAFARGVVDVVGAGAGTDQLARLFEDDALYEGGADAAQQLPTFISNHDAGRFAYFVARANRKIDNAELLARVKLGYAMLLTLRGVPTIYSGDEQGFVGDGGDQDAREDMFPSRVAVYNDNRLLGTGATTAASNFDAAHPIYRLIASLSRLRSATPALRRGKTIVRVAGEKPGLFAVTRTDPETGREVLIAFNTSTQAVTGNVEVAVRSARFSALHGQCAARATAPGSVSVTIPALDFVICAADQ